MSYGTYVHRQPFRERLARNLAYGLLPLYFLMRRKRKPWTTTLADMQQMPPGSLGNEIAAFLVQHNMQLIPRAEWHDVYHVLFGYGTNIRDEGCVQFLPLGNGRRSIPYLVCNLVSALLYPEYWSDFYDAYHKGKAARKFHDWNFEPLLKLPIAEVRAQIFGDRPLP